jgi:solute carrier family 25 carnitine/acylcarnitine transporter 20/29
MSSEGNIYQSLDNIQFFLALKDLTAGSIGGMTQCISGHPLDTVKVRLQTQPTSEPLKYKGALDCFAVTIKEEGFKGLYKGVQSPLLGMTLLNSALFLSYGQTKSFLQKDKNDILTIPQIFLAGGIVGLIVSFIECPVDLFKSQLQVQYEGKIKYNGFLDCASKIIKNHGIRGMYQGLGGTILRDVPANACYFGFYEWSKRSMITTEKTVDDLPSWKLLLSGGIGGIAYWSLTYPADVIKSTMQTDSTIKEERNFLTIVETAKKFILKKEFLDFLKDFILV